MTYILVKDKYHYKENAFETGVCKMAVISFLLWCVDVTLSWSICSMCLPSYLSNTYVPTHNTDYLPDSQKLQKKSSSVCHFACPSVFSRVCLPFSDYLNLYGWPRSFTHLLVYKYRHTSSIKCTKAQNLNVSRLAIVLAKYIEVRREIDNVDVVCRSYSNYMWVINSFNVY